MLLFRRALSSQAHAMSATAQQRAMRMKAREESDPRPQQSKVTLQAVLNKTKKFSPIDELYEMQNVKSAAHDHREKKMKGQIPFDHANDAQSRSSKDSKSNSNKAGANSSAGDSSEFNNKNSNWIPLLTAVMGLISLTIFSANKLNAQADHVQSGSEGTVAIETNFVPESRNNIAIIDEVIVEQRQSPILQQPLWLQRERSDHKSLPKP